MALLITPTARTGTWPTTPAAAHWRIPASWLPGAMCIHAHESGDWHRAWTDWTGRPSIYAGGMQFTEATWRSAGGAGQPWQWSPREQLYRAWIRWRADGDRWAVEWGSAGVCHLR